MDSIDFEYVDFKSEANENIIRNYDVLSEQDEMKCGSVFVSRNYEYTFICEFCNDRFSDLLNFGIHYQSSHSNGTKPTLESSVSSPEEYREEEHPMSSIKESPLRMDDDESEPEPIIPPIYEATVNEKDNEDAATKKSSKDTTRLFCEVCGRSYCSKASYNHHKKIHDRIRKLRTKSNQATVTKPKTIETDEDDSTNPGKTTLKAPPKPYCDLCNRSFRQSIKFRQHADIFHAARPPKQLQVDPSYWACIYCRKTLETVADRIEHEKVHVDEAKPFACSFCPLAFDMNSRRELHERIHNGVRPYQCSYCPKRFCKKYECDVHVSKHTGDMKYPCEYCDKRFARAEILKSHVRIHTLERPFQCEECGKKYRHRSNLADHRKRHTNDRKSKCDICCKLFYSNRELRNHKTVHSKERPFECETCGKAFQLKKFLVTHKKLHADFKEHECHICHKRFAQRAGLYAHKKSNHGENLI